MNETLIVKFWGVRGSHAVPGAQTVFYGGNTSCIEVQAGHWTMILDAGTGIIQLGKDLLQRSRSAESPANLAIFFSHLHHDHTQGFPFFAPAYQPSWRLHLFGPGTFEQTLEDTLKNTMSPPAFPVKLHELSAQKSFYGLSDGSQVCLGASKDEVLVGASSHVNDPDDPSKQVRVHVLRSHAHPGGVLIYRIEWGGRAVVYATDTEGYVGNDRRLADFSQGADLLIHDAQYAEAHYQGQAPGLPATQGFGHSTARMACDMAQAAGVKRLMLFHHDPNYNDEDISNIEAHAQVLFPRVQAAYEGLELEIGQGDNEAHAQTLKLTPSPYITRYR